jgi:hypothetical protein
MRKRPSILAAVPAGVDKIDAVDKPLVFYSSRLCPRGNS